MDDRKKSGPETEEDDDMEEWEDESLKMEAATEHAPDLRRAPDGSVSFAATQQPEFRTTGPDGRSSDPVHKSGHRPALGPITQDDPMPIGLHAYPDTGHEGDVTLVAVFEDITGARSCVNDLERRALGVEVGIVSRRGDGPEQGISPGNVITGPGYGLSAEGQSPPRDPGMGSGVAVGASIGATAGLLASTYAIPPWGVIIATGSLISTLVGAGIGSFLGGLTEYLTSEQQDGDDASIYAGEVRKGGVLLLCRTTQDNVDQVRQLIELWEPLEIRVQ